MFHRPHKSGGGTVTAKSKRRRIMHRIHRGAHKVSTKTRIVNTAALLIGASPVIESAWQNLPSGNFNGFKNDIMQFYTGFDTSGGFAAQRLFAGYGPLVGAIVFKKAMGKLKASKLII